MTIIHSIILGIVEGLTEFLPVSSTAHLIIVSNFLKISQTDFQKFFEVFIQAGAILAIVFLYVNYLIKNKHLIKKLILSFIPTAIIGLLLYKIIKTVFFGSNNLIIFAMFTIGVIFLILEYLVKNKKILLNKSLSEMSWQEAIFVGLAQSLAVVPGVSRAGIVIVAMMFGGYKRDQSAIYSFLLAVPTILAASILDFYKMRGLLNSSGNNILVLAIGFITSFVVAYLVVKWFLNYLKTNSLIVFGIYRIVLAVILFFVMK